MCLNRLLESQARFLGEQPFPAIDASAFGGFREDLIWRNGSEGYVTVGVGLAEGDSRERAPDRLELDREAGRKECGGGNREGEDRMLIVVRHEDLGCGTGTPPDRAFAYAAPCFGLQVEVRDVEDAVGLDREFLANARLMGGDPVADARGDRIWVWVVINVGEATKTLVALPPSP